MTPHTTVSVFYKSYLNESKDVMLKQYTSIGFKCTHIAFMYLLYQSRLVYTCVCTLDTSDGM